MSAHYSSRGFNRHFLGLRGCLALLILQLGLLGAGSGWSQTLNAVDRGWWNDSADDPHQATNKNTLTGFAPFYPGNFNSYFVFDVGDQGLVGAATLRLELESFTSPDSEETIEVYDVSTAIATLEADGFDLNVFNDLQSGNLYGTIQVNAANLGQVLEIPLNAQAVSDIKASSGLFAVGVHVSNVGQTVVDEYVRFSAADEARTHQLVLEPSSECTIAIPSTGTATPYPDTKDISGAPENLSKVVARISGLHHTFPDDLDILLVGPGGQSVVLMSDAGGNGDVDGIELTFDDDAGTTLPNSLQLDSGTYRPTNYQGSDPMPAPAPAGPYGDSLSVFNGTNANGTWSLYVLDDVSQDFGCIESWSLQFTAVCEAPAEAETPTPADGAVNIPLSTTLSWGEGDCLLIEDYEDGNITEYTDLGASYTLTAEAAHDGDLGLAIDTPNTNVWLYAKAPRFAMHYGSIISCYVKLTEASNRAFFGFGSSAAGTYSLTLAPNSDALILQRIDGLTSYNDLNSVPQSYVTGAWYRIEVEWAPDGTIIGRLYSDGGTLLNTVSASDTTYVAGTIAFRGFGTSHFDTVTKCLLPVVPFGAFRLANLGALPVMPDPATAIGWDKLNNASIFPTPDSAKAEAAKSAMIATKIQGDLRPSRTMISTNTLGPLLLDNGPPNAAASNEATGWLQAEDFTLTSPALIQSVRFWTSQSGTWDGSCTATIYEDNGSGEPGAVVISSSVAVTHIATGTGNQYQDDFDFPAPVALNPGTYWLGINMSADCNGLDGVGWEWATNTSGVHGKEMANCAGAWSGNGAEHAFQLYGVQGCPVTYDVYLDTSNPPTTLLASDLTVRSVPTGPLTAGATYYWQVVTKNAANATPGPIWTFYTQPSATCKVLIPNSGPASAYPTYFTANNAPYDLAKVTVHINDIHHTFPDDLDILLVGPQGQNVMLMSDAGGTGDLDGADLTFDDDALTTLPNGGQIAGGSYKPTDYGTPETMPAPAPAGPYGSALSVFNGSNANGTWQLYISDDAGGDFGCISGWSLDFVSAPPVYGAQFVSHTIPAQIPAGHGVLAQITMKNTGNTDWTLGGNFALAVTIDDCGMAPSNRIPLGAASTVHPGQNYTFETLLTAPGSSGGSCNLKFQMVLDPGTFFGDEVIGSPAIIEPLNNAIPLSTTIPLEVHTGQGFGVGITFRNTGNTTWLPGDYSLRVATDDCNLFNGVPKLEVLPGDAVGPNKMTQFLGHITAPMAAGPCNLTLQMQEVDSVFGTTMNLIVNVIEPPNAATGWELYE